MRNVYLSTLALAILSGCNTAPPAPTVDVAAEQAKIREAEAANQKNWAARDAEAILTFYADDATFMTPGMPALKGKDAMRPVLKTMMADPNLKMSRMQLRYPIRE